MLRVATTQGMRRRCWRLLMLGSAPLLITATISMPARAHPWGPAAGASVALYDNATTRSTNLDGIYTFLQTPNAMDVPLQGTSGQPSVFPNGKPIIGANTRPVQIVAQNPVQARDRGDFVAIGIQAGCNEDDVEGLKCTGLAPNGGVYKRVYIETRLGTGNQAGLYRIAHFEALTAGSNSPYQIQRRYVGNNTYVFKFYKGNAALIDVIVGQNFVSGQVGLGVESITSIEPDCCPPGHQRLNMHVDDYSSIRFHRFGDPSANPPGPTNYTNLGFRALSNPHPECTFSNISGGGYVVTDGERC